MNAKQARALLSMVNEKGTIAIKIPAASVDAAKKTITLAKTRSKIEGRLSYHSVDEDDSGLATLTITLLKKPLPFEVVEII